MASFDMFKAKDGKKRAQYFSSHPIKISYTKFKNLQQCKAKFAMADVLYWTPKTINNRNFCLGSVGHVCMERWIKEANLEPGFMPSIAKEEFDNYLKANTVIPLHNRDINEMREKSVVNAQAIEDTFIEYGLTKLTLVSEKKWQVPFPGFKNVLLSGIMDVMSKEDGVIYDLKVTKNATFMDEDQLVLYAMMGLLSGWKTAKAGFIVPLRKEKLVRLEFEAADFTAMLHRLKDEIDNVLNGLVSGKWDYHYVKNDCYRCGVNQFCDEFKKQTGPTDRPVFDHGSGTVIQL
jgi:hypothetical protein